MASLLTFEKVFMSIPFEEKDWARENGFRFDGKGKCWYLPGGKDPLPYRAYWSYLENTYTDREELKKRGCRYNRRLKKWYVPRDLNYDDFTKWWPESLKQFVFNERYSVWTHVAKSGQADVYKARDVINGSIHAVKLYFSKMTNVGTATTKQAINREMNALLHLDEHPNILKMQDWGANEETGRRHIISDWLAGSLDSWIGKTPEEKCDQFLEIYGLAGSDFDEGDIAGVRASYESYDATDWLQEQEFLIGILNGLSFAHSKGIYHRDIKPANILFDADSENEDGILRTVLCDFGTSKFFENNEYNAGFIQDQNTVVDLRTAPYRPEFNPNNDAGREELRNQQTWDLFAWAIIAIELIANEGVYDSVEEALELLDNKVSPIVGDEVVKLLKSALASDPSSRPQNIDDFRKKFVSLIEEIE